MKTNIPHWLEWVRELQSVAQSGLAYCQNVYDIERYHQIRALAERIAAQHTDASQPYLHDLFSREQGYATPKIDVRGVVFREGKILLVKELADGGWTLPGGWVDIGEPPSLACEREVREESGFVVKASKLLAVYDRDLHGHDPSPFHAYKLFFLCELLGGAAETSIETGGAEFFTPGNYPPLSLLRTTAEELDRMFVHLQQPALPTDFD